MFGWLKRLTRRPPPRAVFRFHDGYGDRWADPVEAWGRIEDAAGADWPELIGLLRAAPPPGAAGPMLDLFRKNQESAAKKLAEVVRTGFGLKPFDPETGKGLTRSECVALAGRFLSYLGELADAARPFERSPSPTG